jgi:hypothetical protein
LDLGYFKRLEGEGSGMRKAFFLVLLLMAVPWEIYAQDRRPSAFIGTSQQNENTRRCSINLEALKAAAAGKLRSNGYRIHHTREYDSMNVWLDVTATSVSGVCSAYLGISFAFHNVVNSNWESIYDTEVIICQKGYLVSGPANTTQTALRESVIELVEICVSEEEKKNLTR